MTLLQDGQWIGNTYQVERFLGEGAFAEVYRVRHRFLGRQAMKVFKATGLTLPEIETMLEEAVLLSQIGHPNIIRVFDANITETPLGMLGYFTMEYIAGGSLDPGRLIGKRTGYEGYDLEAVIEKAAATGTALELNASPERLDLSAESVRLAAERGATIVINTDAHSTATLDAMSLGVRTARRAWLTKEHVVNARPVSRIREKKRAGR